LKSNKTDEKHEINALPWIDADRRELAKEIIERHTTKLLSIPVFHTILNDR
jgi:hypothetical protein